MLGQGHQQMYPLRQHHLCKASVLAAGLRPHAVCQRRHDSMLCAEPSAVAVFTGHCHQQCSQHAGYGLAGPPVVCGAHHQQMGAWHLTRHHWPDADQQSCHYSQPSSRTSRSRGSINSTNSTSSNRPARAWPRHTSTPAAAGEAAAAADLPSKEGRLTPSTRHGWPAAQAAACAVHAGAAAGASGGAAASAQAAALTVRVAAEPSAAAVLPQAEQFGASIPSPISSQSTNATTNTSSSSSRRLDPELGKYSYRLLVSYDGTAYSGWQLQSRAPTIQAEIERALSTVVREHRKTLCVCAAGRTDAGVHAVGQVVQFMTNSTSLDPERLPFKLNSLLPYDIRIMAMSRTAPDFNVTVSAIGKTYHYHLDTGACHDPLRVRYSHHVRKLLDLDAMRAAAALLVGTHDFTQFSNESSERLRRNPVKTLERLDVVQLGPTHIRLEVQGSGFLYKQVRHMSGALLAVGEGKLGLEDIQQRLEVGSSRAPGAGGLWRGYNVAPAKGLQLFCIEYPAGVDDPNSLLYPHLPHDEFGRLLMRIPGSSSVEEE